MTATITNVVVDTTGKVTLNNPGTPANPILTWTDRGGKLLGGTVALAEATVTSWQMAAGFQVGDQAVMQRVALGSPGIAAVGPVFTATVPAPPVPKPVKMDSPPKVSGTYQVGDTLTATPGVFENDVADSYRWLGCTTAQQGVLADQVPIAGQTGLTYKLQDSDAGRLVTFEQTAKGAAGDTVVGHGWGSTPVASDTPPPPSGVTEGFAGWWCWGQAQGGPGGSTLMGKTTAPSTAWSDGFELPIAAGQIVVPAKNDLWGTLTTGPASSYGLPALPAGVGGQVAMFECSAAEVANIPATGYGAVMAKLFAAFGTEQVGNPAGVKPPNVSGRYGAWICFPTDFAVPETKTDWINLMQFKQSQSNAQNDPMWWVNVSSYYWAQQTQSKTAWATSARPSKLTDPVMYLNCEGGPIVPMLMAVPLGRWFHLEAVLTQGSQIVFTVDGGAFSTAPASHYPVGPDGSHPGRWIFGIGNYATFAGKVYGAGASFQPA